MFVPWCNGSTAVFGTACLGSNPGGTTFKKIIDCISIRFAVDFVLGWLLGWLFLRMDILLFLLNISFLFPDSLIVEKSFSIYLAFESIFLIKELYSLMFRGLAFNLCIAIIILTVLHFLYFVGIFPSITNLRRLIG